MDREFDKQIDEKIIDNTQETERKDIENKDIINKENSGDESSGEIKNVNLNSDIRNEEYENTQMRDNENPLEYGKERHDIQNESLENENSERESRIESKSFKEDENKEDLIQDVEAAYESAESKDKKKYRKKKRGAGAYIFKLLASAAVFGLVAGAAMVAVNKRFNQASPSSNIIIGKQTSAVSAPALVNTNTSGVSDVSGIVEKAMPSVVAINATSSVEARSLFGGSRVYETNSSGSGIIIGKNNDELLIVTNNHVVQNTTDLSVVFIDKTEVKATLKGGDSESDVAIIAVKLSDISEETRGNIEIATIGDSENLKVGQGVVAIGNALGYGQSVTVGYIGALDREVKVDETTTRNLLQTDAAINPGNSGGALLNMKGEVIAINSAKYSSTEVEGMGYAIPISKIQDIISELSSKETRTLVSEEDKGYIGIQGQNIDEQMSASYDIPVGIYVYKIVEDGAAKKSDLREKDIITKLDGQTVKTMEELRNMLNYYAAGDKVNLTIKRLNGSSYEEQKVEVTLGKRGEVIN